MVEYICVLFIWSYLHGRSVVKYIGVLNIWSYLHGRSIVEYTGVWHIKSKRTVGFLCVSQKKLILWGSCYYWSLKLTFEILYISRAETKVISHTLCFRIPPGQVGDGSGCAMGAVSDREAHLRPPSAAGLAPAAGHHHGNPGAQGHAGGHLPADAHTAVDGGVASSKCPLLSYFLVIALCLYF